MKREDIVGFLVYLIIFAFAIVFGLLVLREHASHAGLDTGIYLLYILGAIASGVIFNSILFELGHVLGAKVGGYKVLSVNVLGFMFLFDGSGKKFRFKNYDGLTGETKIAPVEGKKNNPNPYLIFGSLLFALEAVSIVIAFITLNGAERSTFEKNVAYFLLVILVVGVMILLYNIIPLKLDSINDGYRLRLISNPKNKEAFNELLRVERAIENGETDVEIKTFTEITNFTADLNLNKVYLLLDQGKFLEAEPMLDDILKSEDISERTYIRAKAQKIYIHLMNNPIDAAKEFYDKEVPMSERRELSEDISMVSIRAYILMSGLLDDSESETMRAVNNVLKAYKRTSRNRQKFELKLYNEALNKVIEKHPKWELEGYILEEKK